MAASHTAWDPTTWLSLAFAATSLLPPTFLAFAYVYPSEGKRSLPLPVALIFLPGLALAILAVATPLIVYDAELTQTGLSRKTGLGYPFFVLYFLVVWLTALVMLVLKWRRATGAVRSHLRYFTASMLLTGAGGITFNLVFPSITGRSTYSWVGPYFVLIFLVIVGHAIIRHHFMELRLVIHRGITLTVAIMISLLPVMIVLAVFWPRLSVHLEPGEFFALLLAIVSVTLLVPRLEISPEGFWISTSIERMQTFDRLFEKPAGPSLSPRTQGCSLFRGSSLRRSDWIRRSSSLSPNEVTIRKGDKGEEQ